MLELVHGSLSPTVSDPGPATDTVEIKWHGEATKTAGEEDSE